MILDLEETFIVGEENFFDSISHESSYGVVFEDDTETGYFYAIESEDNDEDEEMKILDALHIYNSKDVSDKDIPSKIQIVWSEDGQIASLLINNYCHAIYDFDNKGGYCRNGFPETNESWTVIKERKLTEEKIEEIFKNRQ